MGTRQREEGMVKGGRKPGCARMAIVAVVRVVLRHVVRRSLIVVVMARVAVRRQARRGSVYMALRAEQT